MFIFGTILGEIVVLCRLELHFRKEEGWSISDGCKVGRNFDFFADVINE